MDEEENEDAAAKTDLTIGGEKYQIVGCLQEKFHKPTEDIHQVIDDSKADKLLPEILKCGFIVFNITDGDVNQMNMVLVVLQGNVK